jgi:REP element-mobilizing transposase RayT
MKQLAMELPTWGGRRKGAGRKPKGRVALVSHAARPELDGRTPVQVVLRVRDDVRSLRARATFLAILAAFAAAKERSGLRLVHYAVLGNHLHLIVEAADRDALSREIHGLAIRLARAINRAQERRGRVFADHYFEHPLRTPAEARHAIRYVEENQRLQSSAPAVRRRPASTPARRRPGMRPSLRRGPGYCASAGAAPAGGPGGTSASRNEERPSLSRAQAKELPENPRPRCMPGTGRLAASRCSTRFAFTGYGLPARHCHACPARRCRPSGRTFVGHGAIDLCAVGSGR